MAAAGGLAVVVGPANVERFQLMTRSPMEENKRGKVSVTFNRTAGYCYEARGKQGIAFKLRGLLVSHLRNTCSRWRGQAQLRSTCLLHWLVSLNLGSKSERRYLTRSRYTLYSSLKSRKLSYQHTV